MHICNQRGDFDLSMVKEGESEPPGKRRKLKLSLSRSRPIAATACHDRTLRPQPPAPTEDVVSGTTATGGGEVDTDPDSADWKERGRGENNH